MNLLSGTTDPHPAAPEALTQESGGGAWAWFKYCSGSMTFDIFWGRMFCASGEEDHVVLFVKCPQQQTHILVMFAC